MRAGDPRRRANGGAFNARRDMSRSAEPRTVRRHLFCVTAAWVLVVGVAEAVAAPPPVSLGSGRSQVWILRPTGTIRDIVVFGHGWSTPTPNDAFAAWIDHLRSRGSLVIYPRYRESLGDSSSSALLAFQAGVVNALHHLEPVRVPILALGKSFGASAVFYYAAEAATWRVPGPGAVVSIFPAYPIGGPPALPIPPGTYVRILVGDADTTAGSGGANAFWGWLTPHPAELKSYQVIRSRPGLIANHDSAQRSDPIARRVFWKPVDTLLTRLIRHRGHY